MGVSVNMSLSAAVLVALLVQASPALAEGANGNDVAGENAGTKGLSAGNEGSGGIAVLPLLLAPE